MKNSLGILLSFFVLCTACTTKKEDNMQDNIKTELEKINKLLKDGHYNESMGQALEAAYYKGINETPPPFLAPGDDTATKIRSPKEEKIAINIAGFYALECGIGLLAVQTNTTPLEWLNKIVNDSADAASISLLNRFANATWKAGQPFRDLKRIERSTFTVFNFLPDSEIVKDYDMYRTAAAKLLPAMQEVAGGDTEAQMQKLRSLMQDENFTVAMADSLHVGYYKRSGQEVPPFLTSADDTATIIKTVRSEKIAINVAGFYALECGLNYFASKDVLPSRVLQSIVDGTMPKEDKVIFHRFANATWKAGQPFRSLKRIHRDNFIPFYFLDEKEIEKDWVQVKAAAEKLLNDISSESE